MGRRNLGNIVGGVEPDTAFVYVAGLSTGCECHVTRSAGTREM